MDNYHKAEESLKLAHRIHTIDTQLYQIDSTMYKQLEIAPSDWLKIQRAYLLKEYELVEKGRVVVGLRNRVLVVSGCGE